MEKVAGAPLDAGSVKFDFENGFDFVSGIKAPLYIDNRKLFFEPSIRARVIAAMSEEAKSLAFAIVAGVETAGIAPAALVAAELGSRFVYVRKKSKDHGMKRMIECGDVAGAAVLLIEDTISTGGSSLNAVAALREAGATVTDCIAVTSYDFGAQKAFDDAGVTLHVLAPVPEIATEALHRTLISQEQFDRIIAWLQKPHEHW